MLGEPLITDERSLTSRNPVEVGINFWSNLESLLRDLPPKKRCAFETIMRDYKEIYNNLVERYYFVEEDDPRDTTATHEIISVISKQDEKENEILLAVDITLKSVWELFENELRGSLSEPPLSLSLTERESSELANASERIYQQLRFGVSLENFQLLVDTYRSVVADYMRRCISSMQIADENFTSNIYSGFGTHSHDFESAEAFTRSIEAVIEVDDSSTIDFEQKLVTFQARSSLEQQMLAMAMRLHLVALAANSASHQTLLQHYLNVLRSSGLPKEEINAFRKPSDRVAFNFAELTPSHIRCYRNWIVKTLDLNFKADVSSDNTSIEKIKYEHYRSLNRQPAWCESYYWERVVEHPKVRHFAVRQNSPISRGIEESIHPLRQNPLPLILPRHLIEQVPFEEPAWYQWDRKSAVTRAWKMSDEYLSHSLLRRQLTVDNVERSVFSSLRDFQERQFSQILLKNDWLIPQYGTVLRQSFHQALSERTFITRWFFGKTDRLLVDWQRSCLVQLQSLLEAEINQLSCIIENYRRWILLSKIQVDLRDKPDSLLVSDDYVREAEAIQARLTLLDQEIHACADLVLEYERQVTREGFGELLSAELQSSFILMRQCVDRAKLQVSTTLQERVEELAQMTSEDEARADVRSDVLAAREETLERVAQQARESLKKGNLLSSADHTALCRETLFLESSERRLRFFQYRKQHDALLEQCQMLLVRFETAFSEILSTEKSPTVPPNLDLYEEKYIDQVIQYFCALKERRCIDRLRKLIACCNSAESRACSSTREIFSGWMGQLGPSIVEQEGAIQMERKEARIGIQNTQKDTLQIMVNWPASCRKALTNLLENEVVALSEFSSTIRVMNRDEVRRYTQERLVSLVQEMEEWPVIFAHLTREEIEEGRFFKTITNLVLFYRAEGLCNVRLRRLEFDAQQLTTSTPQLCRLGLFRDRGSARHRATEDAMLYGIHRPSIPCCAGSFSDLL